MQKIINFTRSFYFLPLLSMGQAFSREHHQTKKVSFFYYVSTESLLYLQHSYTKKKNSYKLSLVTFSSENFACKLKWKEPLEIKPLQSAQVLKIKILCQHLPLYIFNSWFINWYPSSRKWVWFFYVLLIRMLLAKMTFN